VLRLHLFLLPPSQLCTFEMPTVGVFRDELFEKIGREYTEDGFDELCFEFGIELDEVTSEAMEAMKMGGKKAAEGKDLRVIFKIDIPANRYDLLCVEGIARSLRIFLKLEKPPVSSILRVE
jgi:phenylalanyl-tRNA synthetase beta chain